MKRTQLAINSVSNMKHPLEEVIAAYREVGFHQVEFVLSHIKDYLATGKTIDDARALLDAASIRCIGGFECSVDCFVDEDTRTSNLERIIDNANILSSLGATTMVVGTDGPGDTTTYTEDHLCTIAEGISTAATVIEHTGITLLLEANWSPVVKSLRTAADVVRRTGMENVGLIFDPAHYHCTPSKFDQLTPETVALIRHVHVDDMADKPGELSDCNGDRRLPGQGILDLKGLFGHLEKHGYSGYYSIEMFDEGLWAMPAVESARLMYDSLLTLCDD